MSQHSDSRLLDDFLQMPAKGPLSDAQVDLHLPQADMPLSSVEDPAKQNRQRIEDMLRRESQSVTDYQPSQVDTAVKNASHGIKVLAPLLTALTKWVDPEKEPEKLEQMLTAALGRVRDDAATVASAFSVDMHEAPAWLVSQIAGNLMPIMISALDRGNGPVLEGSSKYLEPLLHLAQSTQDYPRLQYGSQPSQEWQLIEALSLATTNVMTEYHAFPYFHSDPSEVAQRVSDYLSDRVLEQTLGDVSRKWELSEGEQTRLGVTLLHHAGKLLASSWAQGIGHTMDALRSMPREQQRHATANGYPLDHVFDNFEGLYQGIEVSIIGAMRSLAPGREQASASRPGSQDRMGL